MQDMYEDISLSNMGRQALVMLAAKKHTKNLKDITFNPESKLSQLILSHNLPQKHLGKCKELLIF